MAAAADRELVLLRGSEPGAANPLLLEVVCRHLETDQEACVLMIAVRQTASHWAQHLRRAGAQVQACVQAARLSIVDYQAGLALPGGPSASNGALEDVQRSLENVLALVNGLASQANVLVAVDDVQARAGGFGASSCFGAVRLLVRSAALYAQSTAVSVEFLGARGLAGVSALDPGHPRHQQGVLSIQWGTTHH